ncbi:MULTISPECIES: MGMT family protein [Chromohalobacter]|uniref:MGMT family protein n=2 Tax=Chromohalobacter TaxID=42054 RepID=A0A9X2X3D3_9GAMM|nr:MULTISPECIES: MGMT family protein [Chromohalobacter]MCK0713353.1 MGMT family protein [Chromohalobacter sarecensis]MCK0746743.1 MGMT family protein [Chromohalobacter nigrandesensis]MCK2046723.1 MGMT family protein [Chromohalobacter moromii]MCT8506299.1 MGMT family protein [Chromohalobacter moromii]
MPRAEVLEQIYTIVAQIPEGRVTTYGRIANMTDGATARMVGSAMRHLPSGHGLPWHRVINASRRVTEHTGAVRQHEKLRAEGVVFDARGRVLQDILWP